MRRYLSQLPIAPSAPFHIEGDLFHHVVRVSRESLGHRLEIMSLNGQATLCEISKITKHSAELIPISNRYLPAVNQPFIHLCLSICKPSSLELIVEKSVELGVKSLRLFTSEYSFFRSPKLVSANKMERLNKIVAAATEQSGRGDFMEIYTPKPLPELIAGINREPGSLCLFPYEGGGGSLKSFLKERPIKNDENVFVFVGSEGGFSSAEVLSFKNLGIPPVSLGPQILRVETACFALVSILKYESSTDLN